MNINAANLIILIVLLSLTAGCGDSNSAKNVPDASENSSLENEEVRSSDSASGDQRLAEMLFRKNPDNDGWSTEVLNENAVALLNRMGEWLSSPNAVAEEEAANIIASEIEFTAFQPRELSQSFESESLSVWWSPKNSETSGPKTKSLKSFVSAFQDFAQKFNSSKQVHYKFKIVRVTESEQSAKTKAYFQADASTNRDSIQVNATWTCEWQKTVGGLRLSRLVVSDYEEVRGKFTGGHLFADCTEAVLGANESFQQQILKSTNHWRQRIQGPLGVDLFGHQGLAIGDANGDGLDDLYVCQPGGVTNRLYIQQTNGTCLDQSQASKTDFLDRTRAALFLDLDNDGDQDLVMMVDADLLFLKNDGAGEFALETNVFVGTSVSLASADFDLDGDLDVYVCGYSAPRGAEGAPTPYHDANNGFRNRLLRNDIKSEQWKFTDVTDDVGLNQNNTRYTLSASWEDFDNDGDQDLYVANDFGRNNLFRNDNGKFTDIAAIAGVEDISAGMGVTWGDYNQDGLIDIYVSNMFSSAGNRVAYQRKFREGEREKDRIGFQRHARGNSLFENMGDGTFRDVSKQADVMMGRWSWGSLFCDINNDSHLDILVTNGLATNEDTKDL